MASAALLKQAVIGPTVSTVPYSASQTGPVWQAGSLASKTVSATPVPSTSPQITSKSIEPYRSSISLTTPSVMAVITASTSPLATLKA